MRRRYLLVRRRVVNHFHEKLKAATSKLTYKDGDALVCLFDDALLANLHAVIASYFGHFKLANTFKLCEAIWQRYPMLGVYFERENLSLSRRYVLSAPIARLALQKRFWGTRFPEAVVFIQVGNEYHVENTNNISNTRYGTARSINAKCLDSIITELVLLNVPVLLVKQTNDKSEGILKRTLHKYYLPIQSEGCHRSSSFKSSCELTNYHGYHSSALR